MTERNTVFFLGVLILLVLSAPNLKAEFLPNFGILRFSFVHSRIMLLLPVLGLLGWLTSAGDRTDRQKSGWKLPGILDIAAVPVLVTLTLLLGLVFSQEADGGKSLALPANFASIVLLSILLAAAEELYFRAWLPVKLIAIGWPRSYAVLTSVLLFAYLHFWQGWRAVVFAAIVGAGYSLYFFQRRCIITLIASHVLHNVLVLLLI